MRAAEKASSHFPERPLPVAEAKNYNSQNTRSECRTYAQTEEPTHARPLLVN